MLTLERVTIVGVGLIGGSLGIALKKHANIGEIVGVGRSIDNLRKAIFYQAIDRFTTDLAVEVGRSDVVVVAVPVRACEQIFEIIATGDYEKTIVTDVGSVKSNVVESARRAFALEYRLFVPGHPIAGREHSSIDAAVEGLFEGMHTILTPDSNTDEKAVRIVQQIWESVGAKVEFMDLDMHDLILGAASHIPHLLAFSLVNWILDGEQTEECFKFAASGFYDFTRIASSDPVMWRDICMTNPDVLVKHIDTFVETLQSMRSAISASDEQELERKFATSKQTRDLQLERFLARLNSK